MCARVCIEGKRKPEKHKRKVNRGWERREDGRGVNGRLLVGIEDGERIDKREILRYLFELVVRNHAVLVLIIDLVYSLHHVMDMFFQGLGVWRLHAGDPIGKNHRLCWRRRL